MPASGPDQGSGTWSQGLRKSDRSNSGIWNAIVGLALAIGTKKSIDWERDCKKSLDQNRSGGALRMK